MAKGMLEGKVGFVTGAAQGLGAAVAGLAAAEGAKLLIVDVQEEKGEAVAASLRERGADAAFRRVDVTDASQVEAAVEEVVSRFGGIDWCCNNAIGGGAFGPLDAIDDENWNRTLDICLKGVFLGMKYAAPAMLEHGGGSIVNISTASIFKGESMMGAYAAAKGGVHTLTMTGAAEYSARGVRVNSVAPGGFETPAIQRYFDKYPEFEERTIGTHAMRRLGKPSEIAEPVVWLASDRASFVTGTCIVCDGGILVNSHML